MPRIRSLKYEYFINEDLAQISTEARLLGLGLTTVADREGRMEDRPLRLKVLLFPYHDVDVDALLNELQTVGFLKRYEVDGKRFLSIVKFLKHQKPHPKEQPSGIPSPEISRQSRGIKRQGKPRSTPSADQGKPCKVVNGSGNGLGDLGSGDLGSSVAGDGHMDSVGTGASATEPERRQQDFDIWNLGVGKLMATGTNEQDARSFLGKLRRDFGDDALSESITKMLARNPVDPKAYLIGVLQGRAGPRNKSKADHSMDAVNRVIAEKEAQRDAVRK